MARATMGAERLAVRRAEGAARDRRAEGARAGPRRRGDLSRPRELPQQLEAARLHATRTSRTAGATGSSTPPSRGATSGAIQKRIRAHQDAGASHVCIQPINPAGVPLPDWKRARSAGARRRRLSRRRWLARPFSSHSHGGVLRLTLNRPAQKNAFNTVQWRELRAALRRRARRGRRARGAADGRGRRVLGRPGPVRDGASRRPLRPAVSTRSARSSRSCARSTSRWSPP